MMIFQKSPGYGTDKTDRTPFVGFVGCLPSAFVKNTGVPNG